MNTTDFPAPRYFGPAWARKPEEVQIPTPVGQPCILCPEPIAAGDMGTIDLTNHVMHHECLMRSVVGSVGHLRGRCSCFGGTEEDPPGMTAREAARAAMRLFQMPSFTCAKCYWSSHDLDDVEAGRCIKCGGTEAAP